MFYQNFLKTNIFFVILLFSLFVLVTFDRMSFRRRKQFNVIADILNGYSFFGDQPLLVNYASPVKNEAATVLASGGQATSHSHQNETSPQGFRAWVRFYQMSS